MGATYRMTTATLLILLATVALFATMAVVFDGSDATSGRARRLASLPVPLVRWLSALLAALVAAILVLPWRAQSAGRELFRTDDSGVRWSPLRGTSRSLAWSGIETASLHGTTLNLVGRDHTGRAVTVPLPLAGQDRAAVKDALARHAPAVAKPV